MWESSSLTRDRTQVPALGAWSLIHCTTRQVPQIIWSWLISSSSLSPLTYIKLRFQYYNSITPLSWQCQGKNRLNRRLIPKKSFHHHWVLSQNKIMWWHRTTCCSWVLSLLVIWTGSWTLLLTKPLGPKLFHSLCWLLMPTITLLEFCPLKLLAHIKIRISLES